MGISLRRGVARLDVRQFGFWLSAALFGGAVPELLLTFGKGYLWFVWGLAGTVGCVLWWRDHRREGVAVLVSLPEAPDVDETDKIVKQIDHFMGTKHRGWFRSGPESPETAQAPSSRAKWAIETIRHRLAELDARSSDSDVFLYLHCRQEQSFHLGRASADVWANGRELLGGGRGAPRLAVKVCYISTYDRRVPAEYYKIDLTQTTEGGADPGNVDLEDLRGHLPSGIQPPRRLALAVFASANDGSVAPFRKSVIEAVTGGDDHSYAIDSGQFCDRALFITISPDALIAALKAEGAQRFMHFIDKQWRAHARECYGSDDVEVLLFINGPSLIAFAAGALLPRSSKLIPWTRHRPEHAAVDGAHDGRFLAIIDGDDVGSGMERHFLSNELQGAIDYSSAVSTKVQRTIDALEIVPGVQLISSAGDSAIFAVVPEAVTRFQQCVDGLRKADAFRFSCGIGEDVRSAYANLRLAKASGKNTSRSDDSV
ncbi:mCpol domain-containing protein [Kribbella sp. CA-294648]|uniref:mCpol domain-containing protein n=1 Tax=Kribbella sp. CA-294648 TaxID=3239948 RepID=UPI003D92F8CF